MTGHRNVRSQRASSQELKGPWVAGIKLTDRTTMAHCSLSVLPSSSRMGFPLAREFIQQFLPGGRPVKDATLARRRYHRAIHVKDLRGVRLHAEEGVDDKGLKGTVTKLDQLLGIPSKPYS